MKRSGTIIVLAVILASGCAHQKPRATAPPPAPKPAETVERGKTEKGLASWYGEPYHGRRTASGEIYDMHEMTAAHRTLEFGTVVKVTRRDTGSDVKVRVNDRGPFIKGRIIDLSFAAAKKIGLDIDGVAPVKVVVIGFDETPKKNATGKVRAAEHPAGEDCFWVQVGAFSSMDNARRAEQRLESAGETAVIIEGPGGLHRVRVGPFDREKNARKALHRVLPHWPAAALVPCG
ncbi:MAG: septal ring lytic transglycosylase RlpA family protein [Thermoanaerobaculales bacterium]|nr:septal ring lytic transglycosylase RlpA family protein [Thermoanaerobaculales bacterium]